MKKKWFIPLAIVVALPLLVWIVAQSTLWFFTTDKGKRTIENILASSLENRLSIASLDYSLVRNFPQIDVSAQNLVLLSTNAVDTAVAVERAEIQLRWTELWKRKTFFFENFTIDNATLFLHRAADSTLNIVLKNDTTSSENSEISIPRVVVRNGALNNVQLSYKDDVSASLVQISDVQVQARSFISDTIFAKFSVHSPRMHYCCPKFDIDSVPLHLNGKIAMKNTFDAFGVKDFTLDTELMKFSLAGRVKNLSENTFETHLNWEFAIDTLADISHLKIEPYQQQLSKILLSGGLAVNGTANGVFGEREMPVVTADVALHEASLAFVGATEKIDTIELKMNALVDLKNKSQSFVQIDTLDVRSYQSFVQLHGRIDSLFQRNRVTASSRLFLDLAHLKTVVPQRVFSTVEGKISSNVKADFSVEDVQNKAWGEVLTKADLQARRVRLKSDSLDFRLFTKKFDWHLGTNTMELKRTKKVAFFVSRMEFDTLFLHYQNVVKRCRASRFALNCHADKLVSEVPNMRLSVSLNGLKGVFDTVFVYSQRTRTSFVVNKEKTDSMIPCGKFRFFTDSLFVGTPYFGFRLDSTRFYAETKPRVRKRWWASKRKTAEENRIDSINFFYQKANRRPMTLDSLYRFGGEMLKQPDFSEVFLRKFRNNGYVRMKEIRVRTRYFQLPISAKYMGVAFSDDTLTLQNFRLNLGSSDLKFTGNAYNMRRAFLRGRTLSGQLKVESKNLNLNELLRTTHDGAEQFAADDMSALRAETNHKTAKNDSSQMGLFVVPSNLDLKFKADIDTLLFSDIRFHDFKGNVALHDESLRIRNLSTSTNLGRFAMDVMYKCNSREKAVAGVDLKTQKIDVDKLIHQIPMLDSIVPMLRSFDGELDCALTAVADLDSAMNVVMPTVEAAAYLHGENMVLLDGETFSEIAKKLLFKNKQRNLIDSISVEFTVEDNQMEIYPFMLEIDKYRVAVGGTQNFDSSFDYHISVLKTPFWLGLLKWAGWNVRGTFDDMQITPGSKKYKDENAITRTTSLQGKTLNLRQRFQQSLREIIIEK